VTEFRRTNGRTEQFARAVEALPQDGATLDREPAAPPPGPVDEGLAGELAVVGLLRRAATSAGPSPEARGRIRQRVLDGLAERPPGNRRHQLHQNYQSQTTGQGRQGRAGRASRTARSARHRPPSRDDAWARRARGRFAVALAAALCLVLSVGGTGLLLSRDALPGDSLYWVKRSAETASLGLTFGDQSKGLKHLGFASSRVDEMQTLVTRGNAASGGQAGPYLNALDNFEADSVAGARQLAPLGTNGDDVVLVALRDWVSQQSQRLGALYGQLPAEAQPRFASSLLLLATIQHRVSSLIDRMRCLTVTSGSTDAIGPLPASDPCVARDGVTGSGGGPAERNATQPAAPVPSSGAPPVSGRSASSAPATTNGPLPTNLLPLPGLLPSKPAPTGQGGTSSTAGLLPLPLPLPSAPLPSLLPGLRGG
jgi:hypothetical protein